MYALTDLWFLDFIYLYKVHGQHAQCTADTCVKTLKIFFKMWDWN